MTIRKKGICEMLGAESIVNKETERGKKVGAVLHRVMYPKMHENGYQKTEKKT